jgi:hypothetical protein
MRAYLYSTLLATVGGPSRCQLATHLQGTRIDECLIEFGIMPVDQPVQARKAHLVEPHPGVIAHTTAGVEGEAILHLRNLASLLTHGFSPRPDS